MCIKCTTSKISQSSHGRENSYMEYSPFSAPFFAPAHVMQLMDMFNFVPMPAQCNAKNKRIYV